MNIKQILLLAMLMVMCSGIVSAYSKESITDLANIKVTFIGHSPDPAEPGTVIDVRWKVENIGGDTANDVIFKIKPEYPFSLYTGSAEQDLGTISGRQIGDEGVIVRYQIMVDRNAADGYSEIEVAYKYTNDAYGGKDWMTLDPYDIKIQSPTAILGIKDVTTEPAKVAPGETTKLSISFENLASSLIEDIKVLLDLDSVPLSPVGSSNQKSIAKLDAKESKMIEFELLADATATSQVHKIPVKITYSDKFRKNYTDTNVVSIFVNQEPTWYSTIESTTIYTTKSKGEVTIKFVNNGPVDIKYLNAELIESDDYKILSSKKKYVGNIDSDDYETTDFELYINSKKGKEVALPVKVTFMDSNNNKYAKDISLKLPLYSISEAKKLGFVKSSNKTGIVIVILIVGAGVWWYMRRRKKKKK